MKKILILITLLVLNFNLLAQRDLTITPLKQQRLDLVNRQDEMLEFLLQIPFEQRQYIFPMLSEKRSIPKKIKTHPDVLVWKGKKPTRIAKRFQDDVEFLEFLPAQFYYFLAPEMWPEENDTTKEQNSNQLFANLLRYTPDSDNVIVPDNLIRLKNGLNITYDFLNPPQKEKLKEKSAIYLTQIMSFSSPELESKLKKQGYSSIQDFAQNADKIAMIYRLYLKGKKIPTSPEQQLVQNYLSLVPFIFEKSGFSVLLDANLYSD